MLAQNKLLSYLCNVRNKQITILKRWGHTETTIKDMKTINKNHKFDVHFDNDTMSDSKGFNTTYEYCKDYIEKYNGSNESYFEDYKGGIVSIYDVTADEVVYWVEVR